MGLRDVVEHEKVGRIYPCVFCGSGKEIRRYVRMLVGPTMLEGWRCQGETSLGTCSAAAGRRGKGKGKVAHPHWGHHNVGNVCKWGIRASAASRAVGRHRSFETQAGQYQNSSGGGAERGGCRHMQCQPASQESHSKSGLSAGQVWSRQLGQEVR